MGSCFDPFNLRRPANRKPLVRSVRTTDCVDRAEALGKVDEIFARGGFVNIAEIAGKWVVSELVGK